MIKAVTSNQDIEITAKLAHKIWNQHYVPIIGKAQVDYMVEKFQSVEAIKDQLDNDFKYFLIYFSETPCGYLALISNTEEKKLMISKIYIDKGFRGKNLGSELLEFAINYGKDHSLKAIWLTVNKDNYHSIKWYETRGFRKEKKVEIDIGNGFIMDDYIMEKTI
ncbi:GNAT family N-acetyltransferase [Aegicerativicinus sediminis]